MTTAESQTISFDPAVLARMLDGRYAEERDQVREVFHQEHGRLTGPRSKAITREVNRLCDEVRFIAGDLVDAFGIPDAVLRAPIGVREE